MEWFEWTGGGGYSCERQFSARGKVDTYLVFGDEREVRLSRHRSVLYVNRAFEAARNVIIFPLGRGPGRPAMEPEVAALMAAARLHAERFEAGESLEGYPQWQHGQRLVPNEGLISSSQRRVLTDADVQGLADEAERGYDVNDGLAGVDGHTERGHTPDGPAGCRRCQVLRDNQHWMSL